MNKQIHFSVDDTFGCFNWLNKNRISVNNIFDSSTFGFAKKIYEDYGICTSFYCMYTDGEISLHDVASKWEDQFQECKEWMKFGFHCYDGKSNYSAASVIEIENDYTKVMNALVKITGGKECFTDTIRLHYFAGSNDTVNFLKEAGINRLLCADDDRGSYNLSEDAEKELKLKGFWYNESIGMEYVITDFRLENIEDIDKEICKIKQSSRNNFAIFTHEKYLKEVDIRAKLETFLKKFCEL